MSRRGNASGSRSFGSGFSARLLGARRGSRALALAALLLWLLVGTACAPASNFRPINPMLPGRQFELGAGYTAVSPRPFNQTEDWTHAAQAWGTWQPLTWLDLSFTGGFDGTNGTFGLGVRTRFLDVDWFAMGVGVEFGLGYAGVELPFGFNILDRVWLFSSPQFGTWGQHATIRVPAGIGVRIWDALMLRAETQLNYPQFDPFERRIHLGVGMAYQL